ncbi:MAG: hypothetical protein ACOY5C_06020, partial [Pseudomonadota bacterium]
MAEQPQKQAFPENAYELPLSQKNDLQAALNKHRVVRLQPGDYSSAGTITLDSCQQLYGVAGSTKLSKVVVKGGTAGAVLSGVQSGLEFPASSLVTHDNLFQRITGVVTVNGATLENNVFLDLYGQFKFDNSGGGYMKNNRFVRMTSQGYNPAFVHKGDPARKTGGNVWVWTNMLSPPGDAMYLDNQTDATFVGIDAESWNYSRQGSKAMLTARSLGSLRVFQVNGGQNGNSLMTGIFDVNADEFQLHGTNMGKTGSPALAFRGQRTAMVNLQKLSTDDGAGFRFKAFEGGSADALVNGGSIRAALPSAQQDAMRRMYANSGRSGQLWERPTFNAIPDPAGPNWNANLAGQKDSTDYIQNLVNSQGVAKLPAGIYYISRPIKLKGGQGIIGAGADKTAIIAKSPDIDLIVSDARLTQKYSTTRFALA